MMKPLSRRTRAILVGAFAVYVLIVLDLTLVRSGYHYDEHQLNLVPFVELFRVFRDAGIGRFVWLFLGNLGWFFPFGFLLPAMMKKDPGAAKVIGLGLLFSLIIETVQYFTRRGVAELDDLMLNTLGAALGYLAFRLVVRLRRETSATPQHEADDHGDD